MTAFRIIALSTMLLEIQISRINSDYMIRDQSNSFTQALLKKKCNQTQTHKSFIPINSSLVFISTLCFVIMNSDISLLKSLTLLPA